MFPYVCGREMKLSSESECPVAQTHRRTLTDTWLGLGIKIVRFNRKTVPCRNENEVLKPEPEPEPGVPREYAQRGNVGTRPADCLCLSMTSIERD
jgi:hypothetical protein